MHACISLLKPSERTRPRLTSPYRLKCNRSQPCENCVKRGDAISCSYAAVGVRKKQVPLPPSNNSANGMQSRIDRLEGLVLSLMTNGSQSAGATAATRALSMSTSTGSMEYPQDIDIEAQENGTNKGGGEEIESETDQVSQSLGMMKVDNNKSMYFGEAHWATIMNDVCSHAGSLPVGNNTDISFRLQRSRIILRSTKSSLKTMCGKFKSPRLLRYKA